MLLWKDGQNTSLDRMEHNMCTDGNSGWLTPEHYTGVRGWWLLSPPKYTISYEFCGCDWILQLEAILTRQWWKLGVRDSGEQCGQGWKAIDKKGHLLPCLFHLLDCGGSSSLWSSLLFCLLYDCLCCQVTGWHLQGLLEEWAVLGCPLAGWLGGRCKESEVKAKRKGSISASTHIPLHIPEASVPRRSPPGWWKKGRPEHLEIIKKFSAPPFPIHSNLWRNKKPVNIKYLGKGKNSLACSFCFFFFSSLKGNLILHKFQENVCVCMIASDLIPPSKAHQFLHLSTRRQLPQWLFLSAQGEEKLSYQTMQNPLGKPSFRCFSLVF